MGSTSSGFFKHVFDADIILTFILTSYVLAF